MTTMTTAGEGGGGNGTTESGGCSAEQIPKPTTPPAQQQQHQHHPPPSPLSGCYLLVVLPEPHTAQHKDLILNRLAKGFLSWDKDSCHVDLEKELQALVAQSPEGEEARNGERLIQYATENLVTEVLIYPQSNTLLQCIRNLLASFTKHRHIIHAGYTFGGNGSWILQDGTFSLPDFLDAFSEHEVQRVLRAYENSVTVDIHCAGVGDWTTLRLSKEACTRACQVRINPDDVLTAGVPAITSFTNYIGQYLVAQTLDQLMEPSDVVGNIRFSHPTLYVFPGGEGDAALFGINGFNMLVDGGFARKACFWDFARHLDRLDAVLVTRVNNSNVGGMSSVLQKKKEMHVYPQIGHFFCNLIERRHSNSPDGDKDTDPLVLNLIDIGQEMMVNLRHINLRPHPCYRDPEPINLYHKVGHGTLDMYVLSPNKDSREVREFMSKWNASDSKLFAASHKKDSNTVIFPVQNLVSICALLVWQPANPEDTITRILFPGSTPQHKIFEGFERLRHLEFLKHTVCTAKSLSPSSSLVTLKDKAAIFKPKLGSIERETKRITELRKEKRDTSDNRAVKKDSVIEDANVRNSVGKSASAPQQKIETKVKKVVENKKIESETKEIKSIEKELKETKREIKKVEKSERFESETKKTDTKVETEKTAITKENKVQKTDIKKKENKEMTKPIVKASKPESVIKTSLKSIEKKLKPSGEKKDIMKSSPTTPKKSMNGAATKTEISKAVTKSTNKIVPKTPSVAPAKSTKDANNRLVVERKNIELSSIAGSGGPIAGTKAITKTKPAERKSISRRAKPMSPNKARLPISPAKSTRSTPTASIKSEKDAVIRRIKGETTDSSAVSTPSGIDPESAIKLIDKNLTERSEDISLDSIESKVLADLKEEREVVEEIEAVLQKAERIEEARKDEPFDGDDDITAEAIDKKEEDMTEDDVTAEMDEMPKKILRKESHELTEEDEYLIVEKEEIFTEDSMQSGEAEHKHHLDELESEKNRMKIEEISEERVLDREEVKEPNEEKSKDVAEKNIDEPIKRQEIRKSIELPAEDREHLKEEMQQIIVSATEVIQKIESKDISEKKDGDDNEKDNISLSPNKLDSPNKADAEQRGLIPEKLEESQERVSTLESGATTTAPTLPEDERIPLDDIKEDTDDKHVVQVVKEKTNLDKREEIIPERVLMASRPEVKVLDVQSSVNRGMVRDIVKTPDEVADLPVHEEVDPKLYKVDDLQKERKIPELIQRAKDPPISPPVVKEHKDKGVFSFFGKVADKLEKGIDKLTKKSRRDSDKESEDKSSKSSSPKDIKNIEKPVFEDIDVEKVFPKVGKIEEKVESFEYIQPDVCNIKDAIIKETATFLQEEISNVKENIVESNSTVGQQLKIDNIVKDDNIMEQVKGQIIEDNEEVEAFAEEASRRFKNVKDSLQDSLDSLEEKADDLNKTTAATKDTIADTLTGVAEKLENIESDTNDLIDSKEPEKVKFTIPSEDLEDEEDDSQIAVRDFKEAVRDVAEVLVGTAGIEIEKESKRKNVEEIVSEVAKVLKEEDDFLSEKALFANERKSSIKRDSTSSEVAEGVTLPKELEVIERVASPEKLKQSLANEASTTLPIHSEKIEKDEIVEEPYIEIVNKKNLTASPTNDADSDEEDIKKLCEAIMADDIIKKPAVSVECDTRVDVMDLGLEKVCIKEVAHKEVRDENFDEEQIIVAPEINFQQNISPDKAELVIVTPGSTPSSPKFATGLGLSELSAKNMDIFNMEMNLENIIEEFIMVRKQKITMQVLDYIANVKCVPKEKVINIIQEIITKYEIPVEDVTDNLEILRACDNISEEKELEIENYIKNELFNKNRKLSLDAIDDISKKYFVSNAIVIQIVEDIIIKMKLSRESVFDISAEPYFVIRKDDLDEASQSQIEKEDLLLNAPTTTTTTSTTTTTVSRDHSHIPIQDTDKTESASLNVEELDEDKMVDGFVSISSTDAVDAFLQQERSQLQLETKVLRDFEAVEQEYKVQGISSMPSVEKLGEIDKEVEKMPDDFNDAIEADEKFVKETAEKATKDDDIIITDEGCKLAHKGPEVSDLPDVDTNEKYLDEAKEKKSSVESSFNDGIISSVSQSEDSAKDKITEKIAKLQEEQDKIVRNVKVDEAQHETQEQMVKRMVVTASSEDGGHEIEICPSGTIAYKKTSSPDEPLEEVKAISRNDSLASDDSTTKKTSITYEKLVPEEVDILTDCKVEESLSIKSEVPKDKTESIAPSVIRKSSIVSTTATEILPDRAGDIALTENMSSQSSTPHIIDHPTKLLTNIETEIERKQSLDKDIISEKVQDEIHEELVGDDIKDRPRSSSLAKEKIVDMSDVFKQTEYDRKISPDYQSDEHDAKGQAIDDQSEKHELSTITIDKQMEEKLRKDSMISTENIQTIDDTVIASRDRSKSPSLEKDIDEKQKLSDSNYSMASKDFVESEKSYEERLEEDLYLKEIIPTEVASIVSETDLVEMRAFDTFDQQKDQDKTFTNELLTSEENIQDQCKLQKNLVEKEMKDVTDSIIDSNKLIDDRHIIDANISDQFNLSAAEEDKDSEEQLVVKSITSSDNDTIISLSSQIDEKKIPNDALSPTAKIIKEFEATEEKPKDLSTLPDSTSKLDVKYASHDKLPEYEKDMMSDAIKDDTIDDLQAAKPREDSIDTKESEIILSKSLRSDSIDKSRLSSADNKDDISENIKQSTEKVDVANCEDRSKSPSSEKDEVHLAGEILVSKPDVRSKSISKDEDEIRKSTSFEKSSDSQDICQIEDKPRSPSVKNDSLIKATAPEEFSSDDELEVTDNVIGIKTDTGNENETEVLSEKSTVIKDTKEIVNETVIDNSRVSSQTPDAKKDVIYKDAESHNIHGKTAKEVICPLKDKSRSPSVEKDIITMTKGISSEEIYISTALQPKDKTTDEINAKSVSDEGIKDKEQEDVSLIESIEYSEATSRKSSHRSKSPSVEKESLPKAVVSDVSTTIANERENFNLNKVRDTEDRSFQFHDHEQAETNILASADNKSKSPSLEEEIGRKVSLIDQSCLSSASTKYEDIKPNQADNLDKMSNLSEEEYKTGDTLFDEAGKTIDFSDGDNKEDILLDLDRHEDDLMCITEASVEKIGEKVVKASERKQSSSSLFKDDSDEEKFSDAADEKAKYTKIEMESESFSEQRSRRASSIKVDEKIDDSLRASGSASNIDLPTHSTDINEDNRKFSIASDKNYEPSAIRSKSASIVSVKSNDIEVSGMSKSPSLLNDKLDFDLIDDQLQQEREHGKSNETSPVKSRSSSVSDNKILTEDKNEEGMDEAKLAESQRDKHDFHKSPSTSPTNGNARADTIIQESSGERKESTVSIESNAEAKSKDRSRSQSLFEADDKIPLTRSRAVSLHEDKLLEKLDNLVYRKESSDNVNVALDEKDELELSQDSLDDLQKNIFKRHSIIFDQEKEASDSCSAVRCTTMPNEECQSRKMSDADRSLKDTIKITKNVSPSSEPESLITFASDRPEPHIDEEITISENKRTEVENLLMDDYIIRAIKITEPILDEILIKTSLPKYIILEIIEEILIKKQLAIDSIADQSIFHEEDYDDTQFKSDSERKTISEVSEQKSSGYSTPDRQHYEDKDGNNVAFSDFESPFHKAFMCGMTEIRTTHITTLSGKSTPDSLARDGTPDSASEIASTTATTIKSVPEKSQELTDDKVTRGKQRLSISSANEAKEEEDEESRNLPKSDGDARGQSDKEKDNVNLESTRVTSACPEESTDVVPEEFICRERMVKRSLPVVELLEREEVTEGKEKIEKREIEKEESKTVYEEVKHEIFKEIGGPKTKEEFTYDDDFNKKNIEIITTKTTKTIITKTELDSISRINTLSTDNLSTDKIITTDIKEDVSNVRSMPSSTGTEDIDETLIPLECQASERPRSSFSNPSNQDMKTIIGFDDADVNVLKEERRSFTNKDLMDHTIAEQLEQSVCPLIRDLINEDKSLSGKSLADISLPKDIGEHASPGKSHIDTAISPLIRDSSIIQSHFSERSTPEKKSDGRSRTATPEGFRSGDVIRTIVTTTRTMSDDGEIITTTQEVTEATNDKGETIVLNEKTDVKVDERLPENLIGDTMSIDSERKFSISSEKICQEDESSSPILTTSHESQRQLFHKEDLVKIPDDFATSAMTGSFYAQDTPETTRSSRLLIESTEIIVDSPRDSQKYMDEADVDFDKSLGEIRREEESDKCAEERSDPVASSSVHHEHSTAAKNVDSQSDNKDNPLMGWDSPLCLPSPKPPRKFNLRSPIQPCSSADLSPDSLNFDVINNWGEPMKLPSPTPLANEMSNKGSPATPNKDRKQAKKVISENIKNKKRSESPNKIEKRIKETKNKVQPVYVDLTYVSHHGNSFYTALEFFKKVRARYYVFSGTEPSREVYDALLEAKKSWEDKDLEVTMIPTYDTDTLGYWVADNEEALATHHIDLSPSASRCTINLQDHETSCSAYRLEF